MPHKPQTETHQELLILSFRLTNLIINLSVIARLIHCACLQALNSPGLEIKFSPVLFSDAMKYYSSRKCFQRRPKTKTTKCTENRHKWYEGHCVDLIWREIYLSSGKKQLPLFEIMCNNRCNPLKNQVRSLNY